MHHLTIDEVLVVDHLGQNLPVPVVFCSRWEVGDFVAILSLG